MFYSDSNFTQPLITPNLQTYIELDYGNLDKNQEKEKIAYYKPYFGGIYTKDIEFVIETSAIVVPEGIIKETINPMI